MKSASWVLLAFVVQMESYAQGTVNFATRVTGQLDAPVYVGDYFFGHRVGSDYWGQLYAAPVGGTLAPIGVPIEFRNDAGIGYITAGGTVAIPEVAGGSPAQIQMVAWLKRLGTDAEVAKGSPFGGWGESAVLTLPATGNPDAIPPTPAANLIGLQAFLVTVFVPEPGVAALGILGTCLLLSWRRSRKDTGDRDSTPVRTRLAFPSRMRGED